MKYKYLYEDSYIFQNKILLRREALFYIFANVPAVWLESSQLDSHVSIRLWYVALVVYKENPGSRRHAVEKGTEPNVLCRSV